MGEGVGMQLGGFAQRKRCGTLLPSAAPQSACIQMPCALSDQVSLLLCNVRIITIGIAKAQTSEVTLITIAQQIGVGA